MNLERINCPALDEPEGPCVHTVKHENTLYLPGFTAFGTAARTDAIEFRRSTVVGTLTSVAVVFLAVFLLMPLATAGAASNLVAVEGVSYNVDASMADNLAALIGKKVYITLESGKNLTGFIKAVGPHLMHLEKLAGKDYFDALIRIERISAIDTRFREVKR